MSLNHSKLCSLLIKTCLKVFRSQVWNLCKKVDFSDVQQPNLRPNSICPLSDAPWMLLICTYFPSCHLFFYSVCSTRFLEVGPCALTLANQVDGRQLHADTQERQRKRQRPITSCRLSRRAQNQKRNEKMDGGGDQGSKKCKTWKQHHFFFKRVFVVVDPHRFLSTLAWPWRRTVWRAIRHCEGH